MAIFRKGEHPGEYRYSLISIWVVVLVVLVLVSIISRFVPPPQIPASLMPQASPTASATPTPKTRK